MAMFRADSLHFDFLVLPLAMLLLLATGCGSGGKASGKSDQASDELREQVEQLKKQLDLEKQARTEEQRRLAEESRKAKRAEAESGRQLSAISAGPRVAEIVASDLEKTVVRVDGIGDDPESSLREAFHRAVELAVGTMVDGSTLVQNESVIEKILTHSAGFIKTYETLSESRAGGLCRQEIRAVVLRQALAERLTSSNIALKNVDGKGLFAEAVTKLSAERGAAGMIQEILADFPANVLKGTIVSGPTIIAKTENDVKLSYHLRIEVDQGRYQKVLARLLPVLDRSATQHGTIRTVAHFYEDGATNFENAFLRGSEGATHARSPITDWRDDRLKPYRNELRPQVASACRCFNRHDFDYWVKEINPDNRTTMVFAVGQPAEGDGLKVDWQWFVLPRADLFSTLLETRVEFQGSSEVDAIYFGFSRSPRSRDIGHGGDMPGVSLRTSEWLRGERPLPKPGPWHAVVVSPFWLDQSGNFYYTSSLSFRCERDMELENVKKVRAAVCSFHMADEGKPQQ
jgi:hypothetical protein